MKGEGVPIPHPLKIIRRYQFMRESAGTEPPF
jgi:hypothetical protein